MRTIVLILLGLLSLPLIAQLILYIPSVQRSIGTRVSATAEELLNTKVEIGRVGISLPSGLSIKDVSIYDQHDSLAISSRSIDVGLNLLPLILKSEISVSSARLFDASIQAYRRTEDEPLNLAFLKKLFSKSESKESVSVSINTILLRGCRIDYMPTPSERHYHLSGLGAKLRLINVGEGNLTGEIRHLYFREQSGFVLEDLAMTVALSEEKLDIKNLLIKLPNTKFKIPYISASLPEQKNTIPDSIALEIATSHLCLADLSSLYSPLAELTDPLHIEGSLLMDEHGLTLPILEAECLKGFHLLVTDFHAKRSGIDTTSFMQQFLQTPPSGNIQLHSDRHTTARVNGMLPLLTGDVKTLLSELAFVDASISISSTTENRNSEIRSSIMTAAGSLELDGRVAFAPGGLSPTAASGHLSLVDFVPATFIPGAEDWGALTGTLAFDIEPEVKALPIPYRGSISASISEFSYRKHEYRGEVEVRAESTEKGWQTNLFSSLPEGDIEASIALHKRELEGQPLTVDFFLLLDRFLLSSVSIDQIPEETRITTSMTGELTDLTNLNSIVGHLSIDSLNYHTPSDSINLGALRIEASGLPTENRHIGIQSDYLKGDFTGSFYLKDIPSNILRLLHTGLPVLATDPNKNLSTDYCVFDLTLNPLSSEIARLLKSPVEMTKPLHIAGLMEMQEDRLSLKAYTDELQRGAEILKDVSLTFVAAENESRMKMAANLYTDKIAPRQQIIFNARAAKDNIIAQLDLGHGEGNIGNGMIPISCRIARQTDESLGYHIQIEPAELRLNTQDWRLDASEIFIKKDEIRVTNLSLTALGRSLRAEGVVSGNSSDSLHVELERISLLYVLRLAGVDFAMLDSDLSGRIAISDLAGEQRMTAHLTSDAFFFNDCNAGSIIADGSWNKDTKLIDFRAHLSEDGDLRTNVTGYFDPVGRDAGLNLLFDTDGQDIAFVGPFLQNFSSGFSARSKGLIRLSGPFSKLTLDGEAEVKGATIVPDFIHTRFNLDGNVRLGSSSINFQDLSVKDDLGNPARFFGVVKYQPGFSDFSYDISLSEMRNIMVFGANSRQLDFAYGRVFASGSAHLRGDERKGTYLEADLETSAASEITLDFSHAQVGEKKGLLSFQSFDNKGSTDNSEEQSNKNTDSSSPFALALDVRVTPETKVCLMLGGDGGNGLTAKTQGDLRLDMAPNGDVDIYGKLGLVSGSYELSIENLIRKEFTLRGGSSVTFAGDPMQAILQLSAQHNLVANPVDLDKSLAMGGSRGSSRIPVNCILNLNGLLHNPIITFDIDFPNSDAEVERRLRSLIDSEESMARQIVFLVAFGKFYTPRDDFEDTNTSTTDNLASLATSTIGDQLNRLLGTLTDKVQIGTNIRTSNTAFTDTDIELLLSSSLFDDRLLINGNFGYRDNPYMRNTYVGEFDIEYKLTRTGNLRLIGYSHYNNLYQYLRNSLTTQGLGILYRRDFDKLSDLWPRRKPKAAPADSTIRIDSIQ